MKAFKVIFGIIVIALIILAVVYIYNGEVIKKENGSDNIIIKTKLNSIKMGIAGYDTLNPLLTKNKNVQEISKLIYDSLFILDNEYKLQPSIVSEYSKLENNVYILRLKENIRWQDGNKVTANDIKFTIDKLKEYDSIYTVNVQHIMGLEVVDTYILKLYLDAEVPFFEYNLIFPIVSSIFYENEDFMATEKNSMPIGTGMYKVTSNKNGTILLSKNITYWNLPEEVILDTISVVVYETMGEVYNAFKIGNIDLFYTSSLNIEEYIGSLGYKTKEYQGREYDFLAFNCHSEILQNIEVRQAISYAIDKTNIIYNIYNNKYKISNFPLDYGNWLYKVETASSGYNTEKAVELLSQNGWKLTSNVWKKNIDEKNKQIQLNLVVLSSSEKRIQVAENIKEQLKNVGIGINIIKASEKQYNDYLQNKNYDILFAGTYIGFSPDLSLYYGQDNLANYYNDEVNNILNEVKSIKGETLLKEKYNRLIEIYQTEKPYISLYNNVNTIIYSNNLLGDLTPNNYNLFYNIYKWYREF